ncbi:methyl-accepting chemotaxis protein [soil metagenome]
MPHSLRTRLIAGCIFIVVLSLAALAAANFYTARRSTLDTLNQHIAQVADASVHSIGGWVQSRKAVVASMKAALDQPDPMPLLASAKTAGSFEKTFIGRADKVHVSASPVPPGYDPTARPWYRQAVAAAAPVLTPPYVDATTAQLVVTFAEPIRSPADGSVRAVAGADVSMADVVKIVAAIKPTPSSFAFLMTGQGVIVTHPNAELVLKPVTQLDASLTAERITRLAKEGSTSEASIAGVAELLAARRIEGTDWWLVIAVDRAEATQGLRSMLWVSGISVLAASLLAGAMLMVSITQRLKRLDRIRVALNESGDGNISRRLDALGHDELGQMGDSFNRFADKTTAMLTAIRHASESVTVSASEIASGNMDLSTRTEQQAGSLEVTASTMEQLTATVKQNADNARQANQLAVSASEVATQGGEAVGRVVETMSSINQSARRIAGIIDTIDGIAFQTNILALNAAVEAARAGEQGRGFAVVASEVRSLAQRSAEAAREIKQLIDHSVERADSGSQLVQQAGATMNEVVASVQRVTAIVGEITTASQEQSSGIEQVNKAIAHMDESMQQNAALVEQAAATAQSLRDQASALTSMVGVFRLEERGVASVV